MIQKEWKEEKMSDSIIEINSSVIQHGKENNRVYLMKIGNNKPSEIIPVLNTFAKEHDYTKIFAKVNYNYKNTFLENDYNIEAYIPNFYNGETGGLFLGKYFSYERKFLKEKDKIKEILETSFKKEKINSCLILDKGHLLKKASKSDADEIASLYGKVFESYPFPIYTPEYILKTMTENVDYYGIWHGNKLIALSSSEKDLKNQNTEMTDFATLPEYRGYNFAVYLLERMEQDAKEQGLKTAYTIARSISYGMNITFAKMNYAFAGTLANNTNICGNLESMNIWYKHL